jgi:hypothetical protein
MTYYINKNKLLFTNKTPQSHMTQPWISLKQPLSYASFFNICIKMDIRFFLNLLTCKTLQSCLEIRITGLSWNYILCIATLLTCVITIHKTMQTKNEYLYCIRGESFTCSVFMLQLQPSHTGCPHTQIFLICNYWYV